ncbi:MAG TPA: tetratricopeptide repeat protein [Phenylobacterium sp.]
MRSVGVAIVVAVLMGAAPVWAQSEMEIYQQQGDRLLTNSREGIEQNVMLATQALRQKDFKTARKYAQAVTRADPKRGQAFLLLGAAQIGLEDFKGARGTYTTAVRLSPGDPEAHAGLGVAMARTKDAKAQAQLDWLATKAAECGKCWQASQLAKFKNDIESAIAVAAKGA